MIGEIAADAAELMLWCDTCCFQLGAVADAGMQQNMRRVKGAGTEHDFTLSP